MNSDIMESTNLECCIFLLLLHLENEKGKKILKLETIETTDILKNPSLKEISKVSHFTYDRKQTFSCGEKKTW